METRISIDDCLDRISHLHSSPEVALRAVRILQDDDFEVAELTQCLENEPALSASLLRLVNSSYYGISKQVVSLRQAISLLGIRTLRLTVLSFGILDSMSRGTPRDLYQAFWKRAVTIGSAASLLAELSGEVQRDAALTSGLLVDLGVLLMAQALPDDYLELYQSYQHGRGLAQAEYDRFGFTHADFGARLLQKWNLPDELVHAVADHHDGVTDDPLTSTVYIASRLADVLWTPASADLPEFQELLRQHFQVDMDAFIDLVMNCKERVNSTAETFQVNSAVEELDIDSLLSRAREIYVRDAMEATIELDGIMDLAHAACDKRYG